MKKKKILNLKTARRWLSRNKWKITLFNMGEYSKPGTNFHRQLLTCYRSLNDIRFN